MADFDFPSQPSQFSRALRECRDLYLKSGHTCATECPEILPKSPEEFVQLMDDLHRALVTKVYFTVCEADRVWSKKERFLAEVLFHHLFDTWIDGEQLQQAAKEASARTAKIKWYTLLRPFDRFALLRNEVGRLESSIMRLAHVVARADGELHANEANIIQSIQDEIHHHLRAIPIDGPDQHQAAHEEAEATIEQLRVQAQEIYDASHPQLPPDSGEGTPSHRVESAKASDEKERAAYRVKTEAAAEQPAATEVQPELTVEEALAELEKLIGLETIKQEVRTLANLLTVQKHRADMGLPKTEVSLHMVFNGNPGTGKTTVARIVGKIFRAMGILAKGHLIETDRSGLVAEYAGQTGPKTNKAVDDALDGILFIDEAYSLIAEDGEDPFGREAVQALLKRAEDDRHRLVVILAGYPQEMEALLQSNPGLSSRFGRELFFDDYEPVELARIFGLFCGKSHYELTNEARSRLLMGTHWWYDNRDRHFGNGRAIRNLFEDAVRNLANRVVQLPEITKEQLTRLQAEDLVFEDVPPGAFALLDDGKVRFHIECPECDFHKDVPPEFLTRSVRCPKCGHDFAADWASIVPTQPSQEKLDAAPPADPEAPESEAEQDPRSP